MKEADNQSTEQRIIAAAEEEFLNKGFSGARTTAIAEKAGVTHAMLHYYFRTKEKLFRQILTNKISRLRGMMLDSLLDSSMPLFEKIKYAIESHLDFLSENPDLPRFMLTVMQSNPEMTNLIKANLTESGKQIIEILQNEIDANASAGICLKTDAKTLLLNIISLNAFPFVGAPLINGMLGDFCLDPDFIRLRKRNNVEMILNQLKP